METVVAFFVRISTLFVYPLLACILSLVLTPVCIWLLPKLGYMDKPGGRHIHKRIVPRGGGIAVIAAFFISLAAYALTSRYAPGGVALLKRLALPAAILTLLGVIDDRHSLPSLPKLLVQIIVGAIVWYNWGKNFTFYCWNLPPYISLAATVFWVVAIINAFNLIDGLDGLASGIAVISSCCTALWFILTRGAAAEAVAMLILAGACLGFLRYNFSPAKIFLGDTGSTFLGLCFAFFGIGSMDKAVTVTNLLLPLLVIGVPIFDMVLAVWRRSVRKLLNPDAPGIMEGDQDHLHHRLLRQTHEQTKTALVMYALSSLFAGVVIAVALLKNLAPAIAYLLLLLALLIMLRRLSVIELFDSATLLRESFAHPRKGLLVSMFHPFIDMGLLVFSGALVCFLMHGKLNALVLCFCVAPVMMILFVTDTYRVYWLRAGLNDRWNLFRRVLMGSVISSIVIYCYLVWIGRMSFTALQYAEGALLFVLLATGTITLERFLIHYGEALWLRKIGFFYQENPKPVRTLIFGGGLFCRLMVRYFGCTTKDFNDQIIGIADDDPALHGMFVYGHRVFGGSDDLERIFQKHPFEKMIITGNNIRPEKLEKLKQFCRLHGLKVTTFTIGEVPLKNEE